MEEKQSAPEMHYWNVHEDTDAWRAGEVMDVVSFVQGMHWHEVKQSLIDHDGFPSTIFVTSANLEE